jgi:hypothetical protein
MGHAPPPGFAHPDCYARALGGCSRKMSGEHYISKAILELVENRPGQKSKSVRAVGLAFQKSGVEQQFGVASLVGNILCETHNGLLSPFDTAGKDMFLAMDALNNAAGDPAAPRQTLPVDGDKLERWMLKSLCGGMYCGAFRVTETGTMKGEYPPIEFLQILFEGAAFPAKQGLYWMPPNPGEMITADQQILRVAPLVAQRGQDVIGFCAWFFGFEYILLTAYVAPGVPTMFDKAVYRPAGLRADGSNARIQFHWQDGPQSPEIVMQHHKP